MFDWLQNPRHRAVTTTTTLGEILVKPFRAEAVDLADQLYGLLSVYPHLEWISLDLEIAALAAQLRAAHRLQMVDAIQAATALQSGASCLITNDVIFRRVDGLQVIVLDDYL